MSALFIINLLALAVLAGISLFVIVPSCALSWRRRRLWRLRDSLISEIRAGAFTDDEEPQRLVVRMEKYIECTDTMGALHTWLFHVSSPERWVPTSTIFGAPTTPDDVKLERYTAAFRTLALPLWRR
jgi:hypothetical protein